MGEADFEELDWGGNDWDEDWEEDDLEELGLELGLDPDELDDLDPDELEELRESAYEGGGKGIFGWIFLILLIGALFFFFGEKKNLINEQEYYTYAPPGGIFSVYACNLNSGNCYYVEAESDGEQILRIYFSNGGWVDIGYSECEDGYCWAEDENGTEWELEY